MLQLGRYIERRLYPQQSPTRPTSNSQSLLPATAGFAPPELLELELDVPEELELLVRPLEGLEKAGRGARELEVLLVLELDELDELLELDAPNHLGRRQSPRPDIPVH